MRTLSQLKAASALALGIFVTGCTNHDELPTTYKDCVWRLAMYGQTTQGVISANIGVCQPLKPAGQ